jgi:hypothetical protein
MQDGTRNSRMPDDLYSVTSFTPLEVIVHNMEPSTAANKKCAISPRGANWSENETSQRIRAFLFAFVRIKVLVAPSRPSRQKYTTQFFR